MPVWVSLLVLGCCLLVAPAAQAGVPSSSIALLGDFDGDGISDVGVYEKTSGDWFIQQSQDGLLIIPSFGGPSMQPVPADYDGDSHINPAVFDRTTGDWFVIEVDPGPVFNVILVVPAFGAGGGYDAVPGDYNGDGAADPAVYNRATGDWILNVDPANPGNAEVVPALGGTGWIATPADFDGDDEFDEAAYEIATGNWVLNQSVDGVDASLVGFGGGGNFRPFAMDFDGDGWADPSLYDTTSGDWFGSLSSGGLYVLPAFGGTIGDLPVPANWDLDTSEDPAIYRPSTGDWFVTLTTTMSTRIVPAFGGPNFAPTNPRCDVGVDC